MRFLLALLAILAGASAAVLGVTRGPADLLVIICAVVAVFAIVMFKLSGAGRSQIATEPRRVVDSPSRRNELSELAGNLDALADVREARNDEALDSRSVVAVYLAAVGPNQIAVIKALRKHLNLDLKGAKDLTDAAKAGKKPSLSQTMPSAKARAFESDVDKAGGRLEFR